MVLFATANHMLLAYCVAYSIGDLVRAIKYDDDTSSNASAIGVLFWFLSIVLLFNSLLYYRAFVHEMEQKERERRLRRTPSDDQGMDAGNEGAALELGATSDGDAATSRSTRSDSRSDVAHPTCTETFGRWWFWLHTEAGVAYFLNIVGSFGYFISSLVALFLATEAVHTARAINRATLWLDAVNMLIFIVDAILFWRVYAREAKEQMMQAGSGSGGDSEVDSPTGRCVYSAANFFNVSSSVCYLIFIVWALDRHYALDRADAAHIAAGDPAWYDREMSSVTRTQRSMYFAGDLIYLLYAILLEVGWSHEHDSKHKQQQQQQLQGGVQLKDVTLA